MSKRPDHCYSQSGVIPFRKHNGKLEVLMITSSSGKRWVIPKGVKERYLSPKASAIKEAWEEAGIRGRVSRTPIGAYRYKKWGGTCIVEVFTMQVRQVAGNWEENFRDRQWFSLREALSRIDEQGLQQIVRQLPAYI
jgi:phosphohistidine phosphatase